MTTTSTASPPRRVAVSLLILLALAAGARAQVAAITGATVLDGRGAELPSATVLIRGDRIAAVGPNLPIPAGARVIRAEGQTLLPGLIDLHTHLPYVNARDMDWGKNIKAYLYNGVTTAVDFGAYPETFEPMRRLIQNGVLEGPRIVLAPRTSTPGGHGAGAGRGEIFTLEVTTPREGRAAVRRLLPYRPDAIKVFQDGWRYNMSPDMTSMEEPTLAAIVDEAHKAGLPVLTHTVTLEKAKQAARAGVDVIDHGVGNAYVDDELGRLLAAGKSIYTPTLAVYEPKSPPNAARAERWKHLLANVAALRKAGAAIGCGTDAGMPGALHGAATLRELELLVQGGLTPMEAIVAATSTAARALRVQGRRGALVEGMIADLLLVDGAPHRNIADIRKTRRVFLAGREIDRDRLARAIAAPGPTPIPAVKAAALIDDFEAAGGRTRIDTRWINSTDSRMSFTRTLRSPGNHALSVLARMGEKDNPYARVSVPLSRGAVEPVDATAFRGIQFDARGEGAYRLLVPTRASGGFSAPFDASGKWRTIRIPFAALKTGGKTPWTGKDLTMLNFEIAREPGQDAWLELDNIRLYK